MKDSAKINIISNKRVLKTILVSNPKKLFSTVIKLLSLLHDNYFIHGFKCYYLKSNLFLFRSMKIQKKKKKKDKFRKIKIEF